MLELSFWEIFVIVVACVVFLKPEDVPEIMRQAGRMFRKMRNFVDDFYSSLDVDTKDKEIRPKHKVLGLDGEYHDAYDVKEVFPQKENDRT